MAGPWDPIDSSQPPRPAQPAQRTTPAATALGGTTGSQPAQAPRAPQAAAGAGAPVARAAAPAAGEWDVVSVEPEAREVGFAESAARSAAATAIPVARTLGLANAGVLQVVKGVAQLADQVAPIFGVQSDLTRRVQEAQDRVFQQTDQQAASMREAYTPQAGEQFDTAGSVVGGVLGMPVEVVGGFGVQRGLERSADVLQRGGTGTEAAVAGGVSGVANVAANLLPVKAGGRVGQVIEKGLGKVLPGGARTGAVAGGAVTGGALGAGADLGVAAAENAALPEGEAFQDLQREAEPAISGGLGAALGAGAAALATRGKGRAPVSRGGKPSPAAETAPGSEAPPGSVGAAATDVETQRRERARNLPVPIELTKGQATRDFEQTQFERETAKDGKTGEKLRETFAEQNDRVRANLDALFELTGAEMPDVRGAGKRVVDAVAKKAAEVKGEVDAEYQRAREAGEMAEEVDTTALVTKLRDIEPSATNAGVIKTAEAELLRLGGAKRAEDGSLVPGKLSLDKLEELRKTVGVGGRKDATNAHFANEIKTAIDLATENAGGDVYRGARAKYRAYAEEFKNRKIVADLITTKRGTDERRVALEDVHKRTIKDGSVEEIAKLRDTLRGAGLDGQQAWRELQGQTIAEIREAALRNTARNERGAKVVSAAGMNRVINTLDREGKLDLMFGKKGAEILRDLNDLAADVYTAPPGSVNFSNTASALRNLFDNLVTYGVSGLPVPAREVMGQIGRMLRSRGLRKRVDEAVPAKQPDRGGEIRPGVFEPPTEPPAAPPAPRGGGPSGPSTPPGQGNLFPPTAAAAAPAPRKQLLGRAPEIKKLPVPEVIEDNAPRIPVGETIEAPAPVPAGFARELADAELDAPELADWLKAHRFGKEAGADALRVDKALQLDPEAVQRAATQHARQPGSFIRAIDGIIEKGRQDATDTPGADRGGEGLPREGGSEAGDRQGEGAGARVEGQAGSAQAAGAAQVAPDESAAETARMNREAVETHVAAALREFEKATAPTGNPITDRLADKLRSDYSRAVEEYNGLKETRGGRLLNTDIARELSADYLQNRTKAADVHEPASAFIKRRYAEKLFAPTPEGYDRRVMFTAGGAGAGKSTAVDGVLKEAVTDAELIYDTNMDGLGSSILKIEQALNAGRDVTVAYVYARPEDAFQQAMKRTMGQKEKFGSGRTVPIQVFLETHVGVSRTIRNLADRYRHDLRVEFSFIDNSRGLGNAVAVPLRDLPVVADNGLRETLEAAAQEAFREGRIDADTLAGFLAAPQHAPRAPRAGAEDSGRPQPGGEGERGNAVAPRPALPGPSGSQTSVVTERGMRVPVRYRLVEVDSLITSHADDLTANPAFPAEFQPRDRTRASSAAQIAKIANDIQPDLMAESPKASDGAPIIGPDGLVESGNARTIALRRAYGMGKADHYKAYLAENAERFGLTAEQVAAIKRPALVRERTTDVDRAEFARQANEAAVAAMSDAEQARSDAGLLPDLEKLETNDDGTLNIYRSNEFIREFMLGVASPAERGRLMTADGSLSQTGVNRIRNAVFAKAYDDPDLVAKLAEDTDGNTKNVMAGLLRAAPAVAKLREMSAAGARGDASFIADVVEAGGPPSRARREGQKVEDYLAQGSLIGGDASPRVADYMRQLEVDSRAPRRIAEWVDGLVREVDSAGDPRQASLLGEPRGQYKVGSLADDLELQKAYLDAEAKKAGHADVDAFAAADMDGFLRAAAAWREANPAAELREPETLYHGTALPFEQFKQSPDRKMGAGYDHQGPGVYLTSDAGGFARFFARAAASARSFRDLSLPKDVRDRLADSDGTVMSVRLADGTKILRLEDATDEIRALFDRSVGDRDTGKLLRANVLAQGYDGLSFVEPNFPEGWPVDGAARTTVVYRPEKAKIISSQPADTLLTPPTPEGLRQADERRQAAEAADRAEQQRLADKAKADAMRDEFTLTGSNSAADLAAAAGQGSLFEPRAAYTVDLFGNPVDNPPPAPRRGALRPVRRELPVDTEAPAGDYGARTIVNRETKRKLGATSIKSMADAAAATRYLYKSAVERLDGIVTDKNGKPLAVIGNFKGALTQASVFPTTLIAEAVRVPGAAQVWLSHNHPSGTAELSRADEKLADQIKHVFDGSGVEVKGIVAVAGEKYAEYDPQVGMSFGQRQIPAAAGEVDVPVIERELADRAQPKPAAIQSPAEAKRAAAEFYRESGNKPGILLTDAQHQPAAYIPIPDVMQGMLKGTGGLRALYRAVSEANAGAAIIVHAGELSHRVGPGGGRSVDGNIAAALRQVDVRVLDIIDPRIGRSRAELGTLDDTGTFWSVAALTAAGAVGALAGPENDDTE